MGEASLLPYNRQEGFVVRERFVGKQEIREAFLCKDQDSHFLGKRRKNNNNNNNNRSSSSSSSRISRSGWEIPTGNL